MDDSIDNAQGTHALQSRLTESRTPTRPPLSLSIYWRSDPSNFLSQACFEGNFEVVQYILTEVTEGPHLDDIKDHFQAKLLWACSKGHPEVLTCLLEHGAGIKHCASYASCLKDADTAIRIYEILFKYGLDLADYPGIVYDWIGNETVLQYLLSKGADPNGLDDFDSVPLNSCGRKSTIKLLISYGADVSRAPMLHHDICCPNHSFTEEHCEFLLSVGVDINARAKYPGDAPPGSKVFRDAASSLLNGGTALHFAVRKYGSKGRDTNYLPRAKWLLEHGAKLDIKDDRGLTPLDYATDQAMIDLLESYKL
ncbi:hypothetical protein EG329_013584 [Mollisiaceae sp. DMI_Dod_QoI]|nr:hypothetical protein EG329_013584 [Helotiales sp. DMI_Dod_QoI]